MNSVPDERNPYVRARYIYRARALKEHPPFLRALDRSRGEWDHSHSAYAIGTPGYPPHRPWGMALSPEGAPCPAKLRTAWYAAYAQKNENSLQAANAASNEWTGFVTDLCDAWWPRQDYPSYRGPDHHPADTFLASCLLWNPKLVPETWIRTFTTGVFELGVHPLAHPLTPGKQPDATFWQTLHGNVMDRLYDNLAQGQPITADVLNAAQEAAYEVSVEARNKVTPSPFAPPFYFVEVFEGMTTSDWRALEPQVLRAVNKSFRTIPPRKERARELRASGHSINSIARELGIDRKTVRERLKEN